MLTFSGAIFTFMSKEPSRTWLSLLTGIGWGLVLGYFHQWAGPWPVVLLGPPLVLLISSERPILSWQTPLVAAAISAAILGRDRGDTGSGGPGDTVGSVFVEGVLLWLMFSLFSCPWAFIFQRRAKRTKEAGQGETRATVTRVGAVLLVFLACALVLVGFTGTVWPVDTADPKDRAIHFYGLLMVTAGVALSVGTFRIAHKLGIGNRVHQVLDLGLGLGAVLGVIFIVSEYVPVSRYASVQPSTHSASNSEIWCFLSVLEAVTALIWLTRANKRLKKVVPEAL
jgi:hypothetical protein